MQTVSGWVGILILCMHLELESKTMKTLVSATQFQVLYQIPIFVNWLIDDTEYHENCDGLICWVWNAYNATQSSKMAISLHNVLSIINTNMEQEDASEFYHFFN